MANIEDLDASSREIFFKCFNDSVHREKSTKWLEGTYKILDKHFARYLNDPTFTMEEKDELKVLFSNLYKIAELSTAPSDKDFTGNVYSPVGMRDFKEKLEDRLIEIDRQTVVYYKRGLDRVERGEIAIHIPGSLDQANEEIAFRTARGLKVWPSAQYVLSRLGRMNSNAGQQSVMPETKTPPYVDIFKDDKDSGKLVAYLIKAGYIDKSTFKSMLNKKEGNKVRALVLFLYQKDLLKHRFKSNLTDTIKQLDKTFGFEAKRWRDDSTTLKRIVKQMEKDFSMS